MLNKLRLIILALNIAAASNLITTNSSNAQEKSMVFTWRVSPQCSFVMLGNEVDDPAEVNSRNSKKTVQPDNSGSKDLKFLMRGTSGNGVKTICNTGSSLSLTVNLPEQVDEGNKNRQDEDVKIRFSGGTGIYSSVSKDTEYRKTIKTETQDTTAIEGDMVFIESNTRLTTYRNPLIVYATLTPQ